MFMSVWWLVEGRLQAGVEVDVGIHIIQDVYCIEKHKYSPSASTAAWR